MVTTHPKIAAQRRRVIRARFELRKQHIEKRLVPLLSFAREAGCNMGLRGGIMRELLLASITVEAAETMALAECDEWEGKS